VGRFSWKGVVPSIVEFAAGAYLNEMGVTSQHCVRGHPYSDFLTHDMGELGDQVGNPGETLEEARQMRTAPLWGVRFKPAFLHDGRAPDVASAIRAHAGQGQRAATAFESLRPCDQQRVSAFVLSL
jgi:CxxC motif-containing protein (DUF1111 family)